MTDRLATAFRLAELGFWQILLRAPGEDSTGKGGKPKIATGKEPVEKDFGSTATRDQWQITQWLTKYPNRNLGIYCGKFGDGGEALLAIDVDNKNGKNGDKDVLRLEAAGFEFPQPTFVQTTPTGGRHLVYVVPAAVRNSVGELGRKDPTDPEEKSGIDVKSGNALVVAAGSVIGDKKYEANFEKPARGLQWMIDKCNEKATAPRKIDSPINADQDLARARSLEYLKSLPVAEQGARNTTAYKVAAKIKDFGLQAAACLALMQEDWKCEPPLDELPATVASAYGSGQNTPGCDAPENVFELQAEPTTESSQPDTPPSKPKAPPFNPAASRIGDIFSHAPDAPRFIVQGLYPVACGQENSVGGLGKTTRRIWEAIHLILGRDIYGYPVVRPGPVLFVTKEDGRDIFRHRIYHVAEALDLSQADRKRIAEHLHILDLTGEVSARLVAVDRDGNLRPTPLADQIIGGYQHEGIAQVVFDPWNGFSPGERFVNDAEAALMVAGARISRELSCNVCYVGHVSKTVGRQGIIDAHSGRGGAAMGDNARFVMNYVRHDPKDDGKVWPAPAEAEHAAAQGNLCRLHITKQSYAKCPTEPLWIERQGYSFTVHKGAPSSPEARMAAEGERIKAFVRGELERGTRYMRRPLEEQHERYGLGRNQARKVVGWLISAGGLVERLLPESERRGKATQFLEPVFKPAPALDGGDPFK